MQKIILPEKPKKIKGEGNFGVFEIKPCYPGHGITLANSLRRVLLSSLRGSAASAIKITGVEHEFSTLPGVIEDVVEIILNIKKIRFNLFEETSVIVRIEAKGEKEITAKDIKTTSDVEVINKDAHIATLTEKNASFEMEIHIQKGFGYKPVEQRKAENTEIGLINIDAIYSPVLKVNYHVENMRVEDRTDFNKLTIEIETDGSISPEDSLEKSALILVDQYKSIAGSEDKNKESKGKVVSIKEQGVDKKKEIKEEIVEEKKEKKEKKTKKTKK